MSSTAPTIAPVGVDAHGETCAAISTAMVRLLRDVTGRGPTRARSTFFDDMVVCVMSATLTKGETSLVQDGQGDLVLAGRRGFQETMKPRAIAAVEMLTGRTVNAFLSTNHIEPDLAVEIFVLDPLPPMLNGFTAGL